MKLEEYSISKVSEMIEDFSKQNKVMINLNDWKKIKNEKMIFSFFINHKKNEIILNFGRVKIKYYHFRFEEINEFYDDKNSLMELVDMSYTISDSTKKYFNIHEKFIKNFTN